MSRLDAILAQRARVAAAYTAQLGSSEAFILPPQPRPHLRISWFVYVLRLAESIPCSRDQVLARMQARGIQCGRYFAPVHRQPAYADLPVTASLPVTDAVSARTLALPFYTALSEREIRYVVEALFASIHP